MNEGVFYCEDQHFRALERVKERLYQDAPLSADDRRDLANTLDAILHAIKQLPVRAE
jgi:hypothetical protein